MSIGSTEQLEVSEAWKPIRMFSKRRVWMAVCKVAICAIVTASAPLVIGAPEAQKPIRQIVFRIESPTEIRPGSISVPEGDYLLDVVNGVIRGELNIEISSDNGSERKKDKAAPGNSLRRFDRISLKAGTYTLQVNGSPLLRSQITVVKKEAK